MSSLWLPGEKCVMTYASETLALDNTTMERLRVAQCKMERIMIGITLRHQKRSTGIREENGLNDIVITVLKTEHRWVGHVARFQDKR